MTKEEIIKYVFKFFKEYVMNSEDFHEWLKKIGVKVEDLTLDAYENSRPRRQASIPRRAASAVSSGRLSVSASA